MAIAERSYYVYTTRVIGNWWTYIYGILIAAAIANWLAYVVVQDSSIGLLAELSHDIDEHNGSTRNSLMAALFIVLAPLINLYAIAFSTKSAVEAEDDVIREFGNQLSRQMPSDRYRSILIRSISASTAIFLAPLCLWFYTFHIPSLWGPDRGFWFQNGFWISGIITILGFVFLPKYFPGLIEVFSKIESSIGSFFSRS